MENILCFSFHFTSTYTLNTPIFITSFSSFSVSSASISFCTSLCSLCHLISFFDIRFHLRNFSCSLSYCPTSSFTRC